MEESGEEFEPLFDYSRVQPTNFVHLDEELDTSPIVPEKLKKRIYNELEEREQTVGEGGKAEQVVTLDDDEEDWLPPPPPKVANARSEGDTTIQELRLKKQELALLAQSAEDILRSVSAPTNKDISISVESVAESIWESPPKKLERKKIVISLQDKDGQKQFRIYMDDKFARLFKMYAEKVNRDVECLTFSFDGDKISPDETPETLGLEEDDMIEVRFKS